MSSTTVCRNSTSRGSSRCLVKGWCCELPRWLPVAAVCAAIGSVAMVEVRAAEAQATSGFLTGFSGHGKRARQHYTFMTHVAYDPDPGLPGGTAAFAIVEGSGVMLLTYARYVPSLTPAGIRRKVMTATPPLQAKQLPRFIMVCAWPLHGEKPGKFVAGYAERDEANMEMNPEKYAVGHVRWVSIPRNRAPAAFAQRDYCGEISVTGRSSAPLWLLDP